VRRIRQKRDETLTTQAFNRLLSWLDQGADSDGRKYLEMRARLVAYFDRKNCSAPDDLADETLNRVARRLEEEGITASETPAKYCYIVARFVFMENLRATQKDKVMRADMQRQVKNTELAPVAADEAAAQAQILNCLEQCMSKLEAASRQMIIRYYMGQERIKIDNRRALAAELGVSANALSIRLCRIRDKLEACVKACVSPQ
jgi:DNA-directed RNA polymerase specialized sigma24 family protein